MLLRYINCKRITTPGVTHYQPTRSIRLFSIRCHHRHHHHHRKGHIAHRTVIANLASSFAVKKRQLSLFIAQTERKRVPASPWEVPMTAAAALLISFIIRCARRLSSISLTSLRRFSSTRCTHSRTYTVEYRRTWRQLWQPGCSDVNKDWTCKDKDKDQLSLQGPGQGLDL